MIPTRVRFVRPVAAAAVALLLAAGVQGAPASADDDDWPAARFELDARVLYPYEEIPGLRGYSRDAPADARLAPGSVSVSVLLHNYGDEPLRDITVTPRVTNGQVDSIRCATSPLFPDDVPIVNGVLQGEPPPRRARQERPGERSSRSAPPAWSDPDLVLAQIETLFCAVEVSGITDTVVSETVTTATAVGVGTRRSVTHDAPIWAAAGALRPPRPAATSVQGWTLFDVNDNGAQDNDIRDPDKIEPVVAGLRVTITGPDGKPVPNYRTGQGVVGPQTTDADGNFRFPDLRPYAAYYTVSVDLTSPLLAGMAKSGGADGELSPDRKTWSQTVPLYDSRGLSSWRFVPEHTLYLSADAPASAVAGTTTTITGRAERADTGAWDGPVVLEWVPPGGSWYDWTKIADVTNRRGTLSVSLKATRSAYYRFRHLGDDHADEAVSVVGRISVFTAPVALSATAPATARPNETLTVAGTIRRAGKPFQTGRIVLELTTDNKSWTTVATDVRSTAGAMSVTIKASRTGSYRWRYLGDSTTSAGTSSNRHVVVGPAPTKTPPQQSR